MRVFYVMLIGGISAIIIGFFFHDISLLFRFLLGIVIGFLIIALKKYTKRATYK